MGYGFGGKTSLLRIYSLYKPSVVFFWNQYKFSAKIGHRFFRVQLLKFIFSTTIKRHTLENRTIFEENFNGIFLKNPKRHTSTPDPHPNTTSKIVHLGSKTGGKLFPLKIFIENFENLRQIFLKSSSMTKKKKKILIRLAP